MSVNKDMFVQHQDSDANQTRDGLRSTSVSPSIGADDESAEAPVHKLYDNGTDPIGIPDGSEIVMLPEQLPRLAPSNEPSPIADHIAEARREAVYQFLEMCLLPRMQVDRQLEVEELRTLAVMFKDDFRKQHPKDFVGEFELIAAAEMNLLLLVSHYKIVKRDTGEWPGIAPLVEKALKALKPLLDDYPEELYSV